MSYDIRIENIGRGKYLIKYKPFLDELDEVYSFATNSLSVLKREVRKRIDQIRQYKIGDAWDFIILVQPKNEFNEFPKDPRENTGLVRAIRQALEENPEN